MIELTGKVIKGEKYGRKLGFPTANLDRREYNHKKLKIRLGVWSGTAKLSTWGKIYRAAIVIGPLDNRRLPKLEAHLINFKGTLYGKKLTINLIKYLRPFKKFKNEQQLKLQIQKDIKLIKPLT